MDCAARHRSRLVPDPQRPARGAAADLRSELRRPRLRRLGRLLVPAAGCASNDIVYTSTVDGVAWTPVTRIPTGVGDAELPGLDGDPSRPGRLALAYYVYRGSSLDVRFVSSSNAGASWTRPQLLNSRRVPTSGIAPTSLGSMVGDYISTSFAGGRAVPVFVLASPPSRGKLHEATFATSLAVR